MVTNVSLEASRLCYNYGQNHQECQSDGGSLDGIQYLGPPRSPWEPDPRGGCGWVDSWLHRVMIMLMVTRSCVTLKRQPWPLRSQVSVRVIRLWRLLLRDGGGAECEHHLQWSRCKASLGWQQQYYTELLFQDISQYGLQVSSFWNKIYSLDFR